MRRVALRAGTLHFHLATDRAGLADRDGFLLAVLDVFCHELSARRIVALKEDTPLPPLPFWLIQGLALHAEGERFDDCNRIVRGLVQRQVAPSLEVVQSWQEPGPDLTDRWVRRAFSYWALRQLTHTVDQRKSLTRWILDQSRPGPLLRTFWNHPHADGLWWQACLQRSTRLPDTVFLDFDSTQRELAAALPTTLPDPPNTPQTIPFEKLAAAPKSVALFEAIKQKAALLQRLAERGNPLWRPALDHHVRAIYALLAERPDRRTFEREARLAASATETVLKERDAGRKLLDWFLVNRSNRDPQRTFRAYFEVRSALEPPPLR